MFELQNLCVFTHHFGAVYCHVAIEPSLYSSHKAMPKRRISQIPDIVIEECYIAKRKRYKVQFLIPEHGSKSKLTGKSKSKATVDASISSNVSPFIHSMSNEPGGDEHDIPFTTRTKTKVNYV